VIKASPLLVRNGSRKMFRVVLVGCGNIGFRYLEGLISSPLPLEISIIERSNQRLDYMRSFCNLITSNHNNHKLNFYSSIPNFAEVQDITIVSTPAWGRADLIYNLKSKTRSKYWLIEKVLAQSEVEVIKIKELLKWEAGAWVNTPRRLMKLHSDLRKILLDKGPYKVSKIGGLWGLTCNAIHFIDLVSWWCQNDVNSVDVSGLDSNWFRSKREGFYETSGELYIHFDDGSELLLSSKSSCDNEVLKVETNDGEVWIIDEIVGKASAVGRDTLEGSLTYQSVLTAPLVENILVTGSCNLPTIASSAQQHIPFLRGLLSNWKQFAGKDSICIPIT